MTKRYTLKTLVAMWRGQLPGQSMRVAVNDVTGHLFIGQVIGIGSLLSVQAEDGELVEDLRPEWVQYAEVIGNG